MKFGDAPNRTSLKEKEGGKGAEKGEKSTIFDLLSPTSRIVSGLIVRKGKMEARERDRVKAHEDPKAIRERLFIALTSPSFSTYNTVTNILSLSLLILVDSH